MSDLVALAERVEAATGADRELDCLIVTALCPGATVGEYLGYEDVVFHAEEIGIPNKEICPFYTGSLDAAMSLIPEGWRVGLEQGALGDANPLMVEVWLWPFDSNYDPDWQLGQETQHGNPDAVRGYAEFTALALTAAALRARSPNPLPKDQ